MIKRINIAGIELDNYTVREMLMKIERHFDENSFTTIEEINMDTLKLAKSDAEIKETIENMDKKPSFVSRLKKKLDVKKLTKIINNYEKQEEK